MAKESTGDVVATKTGLTITWKWLITILITVGISLTAKVGSLVWDSYNKLHEEIHSLQNDNKELKMSIAKIASDVSDSELKILKTMLSTNMASTTFSSFEKIFPTKTTKVETEILNTAKFDSDSLKETIRKMIEEAKLKSDVNNKIYQQTQDAFQ